MNSDFFVSVDWLAEHIQDPNVAIIDARAATPGSTPKPDMYALYLSGHIPGARFFDIDTIADTSSALPHMLPDNATFSAAASAMGIRADQTLVIYDAAPLFSAARVWWTWRLFGAQQVKILHGGLKAWQDAGLMLETGKPAIILSTEQYPAEKQNNQVRSCEQVLAASHSNTTQLLDARSADRFYARVAEPRAGMRSGHIPGSISVPYTELLDNGCLKTAAELRAIFQAKGVDLQKPIITTCGSGVTAAVLMLALTILDAPDIALYDGSWSEWGSSSTLPIA